MGEVEVGMGWGCGGLGWGRARCVSSGGAWLGESRGLGIRGIGMRTLKVGGEVERERESYV